MDANDVTGHFFLTLHHHATEGTAAEKWASEVRKIKWSHRSWNSYYTMSQEFMSGKRICGCVWHSRHDRLTVPNKVLWNLQRSNCLYFPAESDMNRWKGDDEKVYQIKCWDSIFTHPKLLTFHCFLKAAWEHLSKIPSKQRPNLCDINQKQLLCGVFHD